MPFDDFRNPPTGRFAPSPTGELHFGSLVAAVASLIEARSRGGKWLLRVEDIDPPRIVPGSAESIIAELQRHGMTPDAPVLRQGQRTAAYERARDALLAQGKAYWCGCSRAELPESGVYPGTCRNGLPDGKSPRAVRVRVDANPIRFDDAIQGEITENLAESVGDFVIWRADDLPAYQLAVVMDDAFQGVTEVVRGADLLASTARQIHVQHCLGLATPRYAHHPVVLGPDGHKLSKRTGADPVGSGGCAGTLHAALRFLGQPCPAGLDMDHTWSWALGNWSLSRVPRAAGLPLPREF